MVFSLEYENEDISTDTAAHLVQGYLLDGVLQLAHLCPHPGPAALTPGPGVDNDNDNDNDNDVIMYNDDYLH